MRKAASERPSDSAAYACSRGDTVSVLHPAPLQLGTASDPGGVCARGTEM